ncbi:lytic murein transglycosylase [Caulobacter sp. 17J65-9]|uniref:lytic murein transglycosylase n=1 Tax=Caulobacter sp. 17J65-9 TaxID=2709382 RepID=UPI0013CBC736|nr:lytic murein transglycosylase [Caulobacter sp. 17J65-9]NEX93022.1 lytic murein transglycosylase [Caulobacter sp. 17J65-9]
MRRRLLLPLLLSACAPAVTSTTPVPPPTPAAPIPSAAEAPAPAAPAAAPASFLAWKDDFIRRAVAKGFDRAFLERELGGLTPNDRIVSLDRKQPEFSKPIGSYVQTAVSSDRVAEGVRRRDTSAWAGPIEQRYGVPIEILIGIWAQESAFGKVQGDFDVVRAFATLAWDGRRRDWAEGQLLDALTIIRDHGVPRSRLTGSWAGAMGQTQFIPENYLKLAQDFDGDGRPNIWTSDADALASAANLLATAGWRPGESWAVEVSLPAGFDYSVAESDKLTPSEWGARGVKRADGSYWTAKDQAAQATLLLPAGAQGPAFLLFPNHFVIRKYNNSVAYALAIGQLADRMQGKPGLSRAWPAEQPLSKDDRYAAQQALAQLGYDPGGVDGVIGAGTRSALRAWQKSNGLIADGYLTAELVGRLRAQAALPAAGAPQ